MGEPVVGMHRPLGWSGHWVSKRASWTSTVATTYVEGLARFGVGTGKGRVAPDNCEEIKALSLKKNRGPSASAMFASVGRPRKGQGEV